MEKQEQKIEKSEKEPKISYHILYGCHETAKDFEKLEQAFEKADVYIPEEVGWSYKVYEQLNKLSKGEMPIEEIALRFGALPGSHFLKELQVINKSEKPIMFIDVPKGHELLQMERKADDLYNETFSLFEKGQLKSAIKKARDHIVTEADFELKREELIKKNLKGRVKEFAKTHPKLKEKEEIKALLKLGSAHTRIYHSFKKQELPISQQFRYQPEVFPSITQAIRTTMFAKDRKIDDTFLARGIVEGLLTHYYIYIGKTTDNTNKAIRVSRKMFSEFNLKDISKISKEFVKNPEANIADCLEERGIEFPETEEEMDEMLGIKKEK